MKPVSVDYRFSASIAFKTFTNSLANSGIKISLSAGIFAKRVQLPEFVDKFTALSNLKSIAEFIDPFLWSMRLGICGLFCEP